MQQQHQQQHHQTLLLGSGIVGRMLVVLVTSAHPTHISSQVQLLAGVMTNMASWIQQNEAGFTMLVSCCVSKFH